MEDTNQEDREKMMNQLKEIFLKHYRIADDSFDKFSQLIWENPKQALDELSKFYNQSLDNAYTNQKTGENNRAFVEMTCGGAHEAIPSAFYNSIGSVYPILDKQTKNYALEKILNILDLENTRTIEISRTPYINEPLLLSDISIARPNYFPPLLNWIGKNFLKQHKLFCDFKFEFIDEKGFFKNLPFSEFIIAYMLLEKDLSDWGDEYAEVVNPKFLDRVVQGIVGSESHRYFTLKNLSEEEIEGINKEAKNPNFYDGIKEKLNKTLDAKILKRKNRIKELSPRKIYNLIDEKFEQQDWADEKLFLTGHKNYFLKSFVDYYLKD